MNSARGAARLVADAITTSRRAGVTGMVVLRADSAFYDRDVVAAARRHRAHFSITARKDSLVCAAISAIPDDAWTPIRYPQAVFDEQLQQWASGAEVAEVPFTAFAAKAKKYAVTGRLIVRRVRDANPDHVQRNAQGELFRVWRHHAVFTDSPLPMLTAEADHRRHAVVEQVIADPKNGPLAHLPSGRFTANSAWLVLATIAFNLHRAIGAIASPLHARASTATIRAQLIAVAGPRRDLGTTHHTAPPGRLALGPRLAPAVRQRHRPTHQTLRLSAADRPDPEHSGNPTAIGKYHTPYRPHPNHQIN